MKYFFSLAFLITFYYSDLSAQIQDTSGVINIETQDRKFITGELISITADSIIILDEKGKRIAFSKQSVRNIHKVKIPIIYNYDSTGVVTIETQDRKFITGELISITADSIIIRAWNGERLTFSKKSVKSVHNGITPSFFNYTTNSNVPYFVQTGMTNGQGNHYYKNYFLFGNEFNYGLTDQLNLSLGFETASLIFDFGNRLPLIQLGAKYGYSTQEYIHIGFSAKYYFNNEGSAVMLDSPITFGSERNNVTLSPNVTFVDGPELFGIFMNFSLGLSDRSRFVVDYGYIDTENMGAILYEYLFKSGFSISIGAMVTEDGAIPNLSFSIPFGRWKS